MLHLAIWFDDQKPAGQNVVICSPPVVNETTALAVLKGTLHAQKPAMVVCGDGAVLQTFIEAVEKNDDRWPDLGAAVQETLHLARELDLDIIWIRKPVGVSTADYVGMPGRRPENGPPTRPTERGLLLESVQAGRAKAAKKSDRDPPKAGLYPHMISAQAKPIWDLVVTQYKRRINEAVLIELSIAATPNEKKWAMAFKLWERACAQYGISPYQHSDATKHHERTSATLVERLKKSNAAGAKEATKLTKDLKRQGMIGTVQPEAFYAASCHHGRYYFSTVYRFACSESAEVPDVLRELSARRGHALRNTAGATEAQLQVDTMTHLAWMHDPTGNEAAGQVCVTTHLTDDEARVLVGSDGRAQTDIVSDLNKIGEFWFRTGRLNVKKALEGN